MPVSVPSSIAPPPTWMSCLAALAIHGLLFVALPQADAEAEVPSRSPVWLSVAVAPPLPAPAAAASAGSSADGVAKTGNRETPTTRHRRKPVERAIRHRQVARGTGRSEETGAEVPRTSVDAPQAAAKGTPLPAAQAQAGTAGTGEDLVGAGGAADGVGLGGPEGQPVAHAVLESASPCAGYFPASAEAPRGVVRLQVHVARDGHAETCRVLAESPRGQGFGKAALACARRLHFAPAHDAVGAAVEDDATLELGFRRL